MAPHPWRPTAQKRRRSDPSLRTETSQPEYPPAAYIQAYEAQLVYGSAGLNSTGAAAHSGSSAGPSGGGREGLIKWNGGDEGDEEIWADRYNIIHLLPSLPTTSTSRHRAPSPTSSSSSWDDLPSDEEDLFNISGDEAVEAFEKGKKRKWLEQLRDARLKEREEQDVEVGRTDEVKAKAKAAEADEIPDPIRTLMLHTAKSIYAAPNPKSLEMRILANHAGDARFAFLRGRWAGEWEKVKRRVRVDMGLEKPEGAASVAMLGAYGSDSEDEEDEVGGEGKEPGSPPPLPPGSPPSAPPEMGSGETVSTGPEGREEEATGVDDILARAVEDAASEAELEEKRRIRREKLEEWKRSKKKG